MPGFDDDFSDNDGDDPESKGGGGVGGFTTAKDDRAFPSLDTDVDGDVNMALVEGADVGEPSMSIDYDLSQEVQDDTARAVAKWEDAKKRLGGAAKPQLTQGINSHWAGGIEPTMKEVGGQEMATDKFTHLPELQRIADGGSGDVKADRARLSVMVNDGVTSRKQLGNSGSAAAVAAIVHLGDPWCDERYRPLKAQIELARGTLARTGKTSKIAMAAAIDAMLAGHMEAYLIPTRAAGPTRTRAAVHEATHQGRAHPRIAQMMTEFARTAASNVIRVLTEMRPAGTRQEGHPLPMETDDSERDLDRRASKEQRRRRRRRSKRYESSSSDKSGDSSSSEGPKRRKFLKDSEMNAPLNIAKAKAIHESLVEAAPADQKGRL